MAGEEPSERAFERVSDVEPTRRGRARRVFTERVYVPLRIVLTDWRTAIGISILCLYVFAGTVGIHLVRQPRPMQDAAFIKPLTTAVSPLGTDHMGRDILALLVHATPSMLKMMLSGAVVTVLIASIVGTLSGYKGGVVDRILMTITDIMMTLPGLPLTIVIASVIEPKSPYLIGVILTIHSWSGLARALRSQVLVLRDESYVEAARVMGLRTRSVLRRDVFPNVMPYVLINFMKSARGVIFGSVGLYFLGVLPFSNLNWGVILNQAYSSGSIYYGNRAYMLLLPLGTITLISLGLILFAQGTDRLFNPRVRARHGGDESAETAFEHT